LSKHIIFSFRGGYIALQIPIGSIFLFLSIALFILSIALRIRASRIKKTKRIQPGQIFYSDLNKPAKTLFSRKYQLTGKPDYIIKENNRLIPIELKFGRHNTPQKNHIFQLAGYCQLIEDNYGGFVPHGIIVYNNNNQFKIPFNPQLRFELESTIKDMRKILKTKKISRNHNDSHRCKKCSMKQYCSFIIN
jgi:CRISPR-associated exonuclease Cas4